MIRARAAAIPVEHPRRRPLLERPDLRAESGSPQQTIPDVPLARDRFFALMLDWEGMCGALRLVVFLACAGALTGQQRATSQQTGLQTEWDIGVVLSDVSAHARRMAAALERVDAQAWVQKGGSETYVAQLESAKQQAQAVALEAGQLARDPEKLPDLMRILFRIESLEIMTGSMEQGLRKYQSLAEAETLLSVVAQNGANRERLRNYIVELADARERLLKLLDGEAQRCRASIAVQPPANSGRKK